MKRQKHRWSKNCQGVCIRAREVGWQETEITEQEDDRPLR